MVKNVPAMQKTRVASLVVKIPWRRATRSRIPAWRILMDRGTWQAVVPGVAQSRIQLND